MFRPRSRCIIAAGTTVTAIIIATVITTATAITIVEGFDRGAAGALAPAVSFGRG
jgi:hypothetical protein